MLLYLGALDPRIWRLVVAADLTARRHAADTAWAPDTALVRAFAARAAALAGPTRVPAAGDDHPARAVLYDPEAHAAVHARVLTGLRHGCVRRPAAATALGTDPGHAP